MSGSLISRKVLMMADAIDQAWAAAIREALARCVRADEPAVLARIVARIRAQERTHTGPAAEGAAGGDGRA